MSYRVIANHMLYRCGGITGWTVIPTNEPLYLLDTDDLVVEEYTYEEFKEIIKVIAINGLSTNSTTMTIPMFQTALKGRLRCIPDFGSIVLDDKVLMMLDFTKNTVGILTDSEGKWKRKIVHICDDKGVTHAELLLRDKAKEQIVTYFLWGQKVGNYYMIDVYIGFDGNKNKKKNGFMVVLLTMVFNEEGVLGVFNARGDLKACDMRTASNIPKSLMAKLKLVQRFN